MEMLPNITKSLVSVIKNVSTTELSSKIYRERLGGGGGMCEKKKHHKAIKSTHKRRKLLNERKGRQNSTQYEQGEQ